MDDTGHKAFSKETHGSQKQLTKCISSKGKAKFYQSVRCDTAQNFQGKYIFFQFNLCMCVWEGDKCLEDCLILLHESQHTSKAGGIS